MNLARLIDHTLLKPEATERDIRQLAAEAIEHRFASICIHGRWVALAARLLREANADPASAPPDTAVKVCCVVGFPLGANKSTIKAIEASAAVKDGAHEIDMVINLASLLDHNLEEARNDIFEVARIAKAASKNALLKVILETAALTDTQIATGCLAATQAGADFVKTSTGFHPKGGATTRAVQLLKLHAPTLAIKASGGIRDTQTALAMLAAGATRLGTSAGIAILKGFSASTGY